MFHENLFTVFFLMLLLIKTNEYQFHLNAENSILNNI